MVFTFGFKSAAITETASSVKAALVVVSSAKINDLDRNTLAGIVSDTYGESSKEDRQGILKQLDEMRKQILGDE
ncbi:MAG: hypothetical protein Q9216_003817 [Gyalolechia sp. 2 TL-2023]